MRRRSAGFTLAEMMVVLVVIGLLLALVPPLLSNGFPAAQTRAAVRDLVGALRFTRGEALRANQEASMVIDLKEGLVRITGVKRTRDLPASATIRATTAFAAEAESDSAVFSFYPDGSSTGGRIEVEGGGQNFAITVDWLTGRVHAAAL